MIKTNLNLRFAVQFHQLNWDAPWKCLVYTSDGNSHKGIIVGMISSASKTDPTCKWLAHSSFCGKKKTSSTHGARSRSRSRQGGVRERERALADAAGRKHSTASQGGKAGHDQPSHRGGQARRDRPGRGTTGDDGLMARYARRRKKQRTDKYSEP
jgi:hypothetical protein